MIISASRRTDIPAFYAEWFINRIRAGYCTVPNPFNRKQISYVSLEPEDVDVIVFWTRNPQPLIPFLEELKERGIRFYFQYTIVDYPGEIDKHHIPIAKSLETFQKLSEIVGSDKVIWRYDPILFSDTTNIEFHQDKFSKIVKSLAGKTKRVVVSIVDHYPKASKRLRVMEQTGIDLHFGNLLANDIEKTITFMVHEAQKYNLEITSCAEDYDLSLYGVEPGKCIDDDLIYHLFQIETVHKKDPNQRKACGCVVSKDIGMYDTCLYGCQYCYATRSFNQAKKNYHQHDANSPSIVGWYETENKKKEDKTGKQMKLDI